MEMKTKTKFIIAFITMLVAMCVFNIGAVNAATEEELQSMLDVLPNEISVDLKESEYEKVENIVEQKVKEIWNEQGIDTTELSQIWCPSRPNRECMVYIRSNDKSKTKDIKIIYNNSNNYNSADEQVIKNLKLQAPKYITVEYGKGNSRTDVFRAIEQYYNNSITDKAICIKAWDGAGGSGLINYGSHGIQLSIFKNDILYDFRRDDDYYFISQMIIPENIKDTEEDYINYALPIIRKDLNDRGITVKDITITKGASVSYGSYENSKICNVENGYTVTAKVGEYEDTDVIILKKAKSTPVASTVTKEDTTTGIKIETTTNVVSSNVVLTSTTVTDQNVLNTVKGALKEISTKYMVYDINLLENNVKVQPNGKLKVSIPIPSDYNKEKLEVYRIEDNGNRIKYDVKVDGDYATFETDHFSTYVLAENTAQAGATSKGNEKDDTPKTGIIGNINPLVYISVISALGIIVFRKK